MDNKTMKACLHLYFSICLNTYTGKKNPVFKIQKTLAPVWWGLVVWRWSLVATVSVLLIACSSVTCFYSFQITQKLAWRNYRFPILLAAEGKPWWPGVPHQLATCVGHPSLAGLRAATVCAALSTPGVQLRPRSPMVTAVNWEAWAWWEHLGDFFRANKALWLHPLLTRIIIRNKWCALRLRHLKWAACITPRWVCLLLLSVVCFLPTLLLLLCKTITCRTENFYFVESN